MTIFHAWSDADVITFTNLRDHRTGKPVRLWLAKPISDEEKTELMNIAEEAKASAERLIRYFRIEESK